MILKGLLIRHCVFYVLIIFLILMTCALGQAFLKLLHHSVAGQFPISLLWPMLGYEIPELCFVILPLSYFLAILIAYGRLYANSELIAMMACGLSWWVLWRIAVWGGLIAGFFLLILQQYNPTWQIKRHQLMQERSLIEQASVLQAGRFEYFKTLKYTVYVQEKKDSTHFSNMFLYSDNDSFYRAEQAFLEADEKGEVFLILEKGQRIEPNAEQGWTITSFDRLKQTIPTHRPSIDLSRRMLSISELQEQGGIDNHLEVERRLSSPLIILFLAMLAVPWSRIRRGQGAYAPVIWGVLFFLLYFNALTFSKRLLLSPLWIHAAVGLLACYSIRRGIRA